MHIKRAWNLLVFIGSPEVLDYLFSPITTYKSTLNVTTLSLKLGKISESVQVSGEPVLQTSLFPIL